MAFEDEFNKELEEILNKQNEVLSASAIELRNSLIRATPVDTGSLRANWQQPKKLSKYKFRIYNNSEYASVIDGGRRQIQTKNGTPKMIGSEQLPNGFMPIIRNHEKKLQNQLNRIK